MKSLASAAVTAMEPLARVPLGTDQVEFGQSGNPQRWPCEISLATEPVPRLMFDVITRVPTISMDSTSTIRLVQAGCSCEVFVTSMTPGDETRIVLSPTRTPVVVGGSQRLTEVRMDILNFPEFLAGTVRNRVEMHADSWRIRLEPVLARDETTAFRSPLYQVTHSATIRRADATPFASSDVSVVLDAFHAALSFAAGRWVAPVLVRGTDAEGQVAWREWGTRTLQAKLSAVDTWFDPYHGQALGDLMLGVYLIRNDPAWNPVVLPALDWYLRAAGLESGHDSGILLLQAALELLSWRMCVEQRKFLSAAGFQRLSASDRIRLLVEGCQIPASLPAGLKELKTQAEERRWLDGPSALASVRNHLVHPDPAWDLPYSEARQLAAWYVELALLKLFEYNGEYSNRTRAYQRAGAVERVPWSH